MRPPMRRGAATVARRVHSAGAGAHEPRHARPSACGAAPGRLEPRQAGQHAGQCRIRCHRTGRRCLIEARSGSRTSICGRGRSPGKPGPCWSYRPRPCSRRDIPRPWLPPSRHAWWMTLNRSHPDLRGGRSAARLGRPGRSAPRHRQSPTDSAAGASDTKRDGAGGAGAAGGARLGCGLTGRGGRESGRSKSSKPGSGPGSGGGTVLSAPLPGDSAFERGEAAIGRSIVATMSRGGRSALAAASRISLRAWPTKYSGNDSRS